MTTKTLDQSTQEAQVEVSAPSSTLGAMRKRLAFVAQRSATLTSEHTEAQQREQQLGAALQQARRDLAEGVIPGGEVAEVVRQLEAQKVLTAQILEGLQVVELERADTDAMIRAEELSREIARQEKAALPLRQEANQRKEEFVAAVLGLHGILWQRKALADRLAQTLPLASPIHPVELDELAVTIRGRWTGPEAQQLHMGGSHTALRQWVARLLAGPLAGAAAVSRVLKDAHIRE